MWPPRWAAASSSSLAAKTRFCSVSPPPPTCLLIHPVNPDESEPIPGVLLSLPVARGREGAWPGPDYEERRKGLQEDFWEEPAHLCPASGPQRCRVTSGIAAAISTQRMRPTR